jgi:hypothetical protein
MTRLFTKIVALTWLVSAIMALTHDSNPAPSAQSSSLAVRAPRSASSPSAR